MGYWNTLVTFASFQTNSNYKPTYTSILKKIEKVTVGVFIHFLLILSWMRTVVLVQISHSVLSDSLWPHRLCSPQGAPLSWDSQEGNNGNEASYSPLSPRDLLQLQGLNLGLSHCQARFFTVWAWKTLDFLTPHGKQSAGPLLPYSRFACLCCRELLWSAFSESSWIHTDFSSILNECYLRWVKVLGWFYFCFFQYSVDFISSSSAQDF